MMLLEGLFSVSVGTVVWTTIAFLVVLALLKKMAWQPILKSLKDREESIEEALNAAEQAKIQLSELKSSNEELLKKAREERDELLKEARTTKEQIIKDSKEKAQSEADRILQSARESIENEKQAALVELKGQVATLSIEIAEKVLREELSKETKQKELISGLLSEVELN